MTRTATWFVCLVPFVAASPMALAIVFLAHCSGDDSNRCVPQTCTNANPMRTLRIEACAVQMTAMNPGGTLGFCTAE